MVQYDHEDVAAGRVRWRDMTPADGRERVERALAEVMQTGTVQPFESELFRKDGSRVPVLVAGALFEGGGHEGVAFVLDLSEQKRTEETLRKREAYFAESQRLSHTGSWALDGTTHESQYWSRKCSEFSDLIRNRAFRSGTNGCSECTQKIATRSGGRPAIGCSSKR